MIILGIETSCDETALALIETRESGETFECRIIRSLIHSQAELHSPYGGVFPNLAKREHLKNLPILLEKILKQYESTSGSKFNNNKPPIDSIAVTEGPGLEPALWTGITFAEGLSKKWDVPLIPVNHMEGHIVGSLLSLGKVGEDIDQSGEWQKWQKLKPLPLPAIALLISGGHTELVKVINKKTGETGAFSYEIIGQTKDDAVGEAFDKVARLLGLPYPGGPHISKLAKEAREQNIKSTVTLPRPMINSKDLNFSFSGLKTAVLYAVKDVGKSTDSNHNNAFHSGALSDEFKKGLAREFEDSVIETLDTKLRRAIEETGAQSIIIGGGVSANMPLRGQLEKTATEYSIPIYLPSQHISGDNALMIALAGALNDKLPANYIKLRAHGTKKLGI